MTGFPDNIIQEIGTSVDQYMDDHTILKRPLRREDPNPSVGIYITDSVPDLRSHEIGRDEPTLNRYSIQLQNLVTDTNEEDGRVRFSLAAKTLRVVLYRDAALHVRLQGLTEEVLGTRERVLRFGMARQRFVNNELQGQWIFVASTDFWVETELNEV